MNSLEAGRGLAALAVVIFHASEAFPGNAPEVLHRLYLGGQTGIYFFFVLSGFVIFHAHRHDFSSASRWPRYMAKRINRIYPIYWMVLCAILPMFFLFPSLGLTEFREWPTILSAFLLIGDISPTPLTVAWTLFHEILFYLIFGLAILSRSFGISVIGCWFFACAVNIWTDIPIYLLSPINLLFAMGIVAAWIYHRGHSYAPRLLFGTGGLIYFGTVFFREEMAHGAAAALIFGVASAMIILGAVQLEAGLRLKISERLVAMGAASYVLYIVHGPLISLGSKIYIIAGLDVPHALATAAITLAAVIASLIIHRLVERPLIILGERIIIRHRIKPSITVAH